jgi:hypothetical protein
MSNNKVLESVLYRLWLVVRPEHWTPSTVKIFLVVATRKELQAATHVDP